uniref:Cytochrome P450 n=1 Tax=Chenopodium quinoa TaxID=63459 RepID=A0A803MDJ7_CHEQI
MMMIDIMNNKLQLLLNVVLFIVTTIVIKWALKILFRGSKRLPPLVKGRRPLIGGVVRFLSNPIEMLNEEYQTLGSVFTMNAVYKNITFLLEPDVSAHFFKAGESELSQREVYRFTVPIFGPGVFYDTEYSVRQEQFHFFEDALRIDNLRGYADAMFEEVQDYFSKWEEKGEVDLKQEMENIIILMASRCFLGKDIRDSLSKDIITLIKEINVAMVPLTTLFPYLPIPPHNRRDKARKKLDEVFSNIIASRKSSKKIKDDMLQCLIDSKYKDGRATSVGEVTGLLVTALYGGQHTGAATSIWTGVSLLHYKQHCLTILFNRLPYIYKRPNDYDPERFNPERNEDRLAGPFSFLSFGGGKHSCLGQPFAYLMVTAVWSYLLRNFELELISPFPETEQNDVVWSVKGKVTVHYERRKLSMD